MLIANIQTTRICHKDIMMDLRLTFICTGVGQGNSTRIRQKCGSVEFLTKLFGCEDGISLSHTNIFSRPLCDFLRIFGKKVICAFIRETALLE